MKNIVQGLKTISILDLLLLLAGTGLSAASLLGLEPTDDNLRQVPVFTLAQTLLQNAMFPSPA